MIEWLQNLWAGIVANKDAILTFLSSAEFVGLIGTFIMLFKQNKKVDANTTANTSLFTSVGELHDLKDEVQHNNVVVKETSDKLSTLQNENTALKEQLSNVDNKLNAMFDMFTIVYSTIKDDKVRTNVMNCISNVQYGEDTKLELKEKIESLVDKLSEQKEEFDKKLVEFEKKVEQNKQTKKSKTTAVTRY
jgi:chromosome segregation ATPase